MVNQYYIAVVDAILNSLYSLTIVKSKRFFYNNYVFCDVLQRLSLIFPDETVNYINSLLSRQRTDNQWKRIFFCFKCIALSNSTKCINLLEKNINIINDINSSNLTEEGTKYILKKFIKK